MTRIEERLKLNFAILTCLGGWLLSAGNPNSPLPVIAIFFAAFGYTFVDRLRLLHLPPVLAYTAMVLAAVYCVRDFLYPQGTGNDQMTAVAQLLVYVQSILMLQRKTRRIFEQMAVFCLMQLVVASVFNHALHFGLLLLPIGILGSWTLSLLASLWAAEAVPSPNLQSAEPSTDASPRDRTSDIVVHAVTRSDSSSDSFRSLFASILVVTPAVLVVGAVFFYALPRTTEATRSTGSAGAMVGFSPEVHLAQLGPLLTSRQEALSFKLTDRFTGKSYPAVGGIYLRGQVLEEYETKTERNVTRAYWKAVPQEGLTGPLPEEDREPIRDEESMIDVVDVEVHCDSMRDKALFSIAPYHRTTVSAAIVSNAGRWTISRAGRRNVYHQPITYRFGTHAFGVRRNRPRVQTDLIPRLAPEGGDRLLRERPGNRRIGHAELLELLHREYVKKLLEIDRNKIPSAVEISRGIVSSLDPSATDFQIAQALSRHLSLSGDYTYTLELTAETVPGMDPTEQFLSKDKRGHCQFYASALTMMLRSVGIPARVVVGFRTEEFSELSQQYIARQLHAHAWVEALIDRDQLIGHGGLSDLPTAKQYWLRLDPTPTAIAADSLVRPVDQMFDYARGIWNEYVVEMDADRQGDTLLGDGIGPVNRATDQFVNRLRGILGSIRSGELGGGSMAGDQRFAWSLLVFGAIALLVLGSRVRSPISKWLGKPESHESVASNHRPKIKFYAQALDQLARIGITRSTSQTPGELVAQVANNGDGVYHPEIAAPLGTLTTEFYRARYGDESAPDNASATSASPTEQALQDLTQSIDRIVERKSVVSAATDQDDAT